jgi:FK506-binding protein 1
MEDDELISEYAPSELSDRIAQEDAESEDGSYEESEYDEAENHEAHGEQVLKLTDEERQQEELDKNNIQLETIYDGDGRNFPMVGDIVRIAFVMRLCEGEKVVSSSKNAMGFRYVEFVIGMNQLVKGLDRALPKMSVGGRSRISFTPSYGYGEAGLPPQIPPNAELSVELTLAGFRPRPIWSKPLLQDPGLSEKPYYTINAQVDEDSDDD